MYKRLSDNEEDMMIIYKKTAGAIDNVIRNRMLHDNDEKGTIFTRVKLKDVFGLIRHMDKINFGIGYTLTRKRADSGISICRTIVDVAKIEVKKMVWCVRHDTTSFDNISLVNDHILSKKNSPYSCFKEGFFINQLFRTSTGRWKLVWSLAMTCQYML